MVNNITYTVNSDLCTGCGICQGACRKSAISVNALNGVFRPVVDLSICNNCGICLKACPGTGCDIDSKSKLVANTNTCREDKLIGRYENCYVGHSTDEDLRYHAASGGMVSQMLIWLLETGRIDGAVVTRFDNSKPLMVDSFIATTREEILSAKSSKYAPVSLHGVADQIRKAQGSRYVVVGLPCHIQGFRKQMDFDPKLKEKIVAIFGLYCSCGRSFNLTEYVFKERNINQRELTYFAYRDKGCLGKMLAKTSSGEVFEEDFQSYYHPLRSFFIPKRCLFCADHYAFLADISFGDIHVKPYSDDKIGINSIISRNSKMTDWLKQAKKDGVIALDEIKADTVNQSQIMAYKKHARLGAYMKIASLLGNKVPIYDINWPTNNLCKYFIEYIFTRTQQFLGSRKSLWWLVSLLKAKVNIQ